MTVLATRGGPGAATLVREIAARGRPALLAAVAEIWGADDLTLQRDLERRLLAGLANTVEQTHGSATLRLRTAFGRVDRWLVDVVQPELGKLAGSLVAGVTAVMAEGDSLVVAQTGPGLVWLPLGDRTWLREPNNSPWLEAGQASQSSSTGRAQGWPWPALGQGHPAAINWSNPSPDPGDGLILLSTVGAALRSSGVAALVTAPETDVVRLASAYLPPEAAFVRLVLPDLPEAADEPMEAELAGSEPPTRWRLPGRIALGLGQVRAGDRAPSRSEAQGGTQARPGTQMQPGSQSRPGPVPTSGSPPTSVATAAGGWPAHVSRSVPPTAAPTEDEAAGWSLGLPEGWLKAGAGYLTRLAMAILPVRTNEDEGGYPLLAARFAAALALVFPIVVVVLAWMVWASGGR